MGFFDFFKKDKGKELFPENAAAEARADAIRAEIKRLGLPGDITVNVEGSKVKIGGKVPDEATRRKLVMIAGNTRHVDSVDDSAIQPAQAAPTQVAAPVAQMRTYTVESGDTLSKIAKEMLGNANAYPKIFELNTPMLKDPDDIYPGQVLIVPEQQTAQA
ncbi:MAG TPA: peptidoglycan-binding protein LysM [Sphingomonadaceae bacterium]|nr:peptidoglycan-binding protein LysM [Sphingomonadaceae bacterium]